MVTPHGLAKILNKRGVPYSGLRHCHPCPICSVLEPYDSEWDRQLRIFATMDSDFVFRCHRCGTSLNSLQLYAWILERPINEVADLMFMDGIIAQPYSTEKILKDEWAERLMKYIPRGSDLYRNAISTGRIFPARFGQWLAFNSSHGPVPLPPGLIPTRRATGDYTVRVLRDIYGRLSKAELWSEHGLPLGTFSYCDAPLTFSMPSWTAYCDLNELILCDTEQTATVVEWLVAGWPESARIPVAVAVDLECFPIACRLPFERAWYITREDNVGQLGLALYRRGMTEVRIRRIAGTHDDPMPSLNGVSREEFCSPDLPHCIEEVVDRIVHGTQGPLTSRLGRVLGRRYLSGEVKREVFHRCAYGMGIPKDALLNQLEADANPFGVLDKGRLFVCRNGRYFMKDRQNHWTKLSNFSIQTIEKTVNRRGNAIHKLLLSVDGRQTTFKVTDALLDSPPRLWKAARQAAALGGLPELLMQNAQHRHLLPSLVKSTADTSCPPKF